MGALYSDFEGKVYAFDLAGSGITLSPLAFGFMLKYKLDIEKLNYYAWAKFMESINDEAATTKLLDKLERSTPKRSDLSVYREILSNEFEQHNCFYCGRKLIGKIHVDHFIPWSFIKEDKIWNFVLACASCNIKKKNMLPSKYHIAVIERRNIVLREHESQLIRNDFESYSEDIISNMWEYARLGGFKVVSAYSTFSNP